MERTRRAPEGTKRQSVRTHAQRLALPAEDQLASPACRHGAVKGTTAADADDAGQSPDRRRSREPKVQAATRMARRASEWGQYTGSGAMFASSRFPCASSCHWPQHPTAASDLPCCEVKHRKQGDARIVCNPPRCLLCRCCNDDGVCSRPVRIASFSLIVSPRWRKCRCDRAAASAMRFPPIARLTCSQPVCSAHTQTI